MSEETRLKQKLVQKISPRYSYSGYVTNRKGMKDKDYYEWRSGEYKKGQEELDSKREGKINEVFKNASPEFQSKFMEAFHSDGSPRPKTFRVSKAMNELMAMAESEGVNINKITYDLERVYRGMNKKELDLYHKNNKLLQPGADDYRYGRNYDIDETEDYKIKKSWERDYKDPEDSGLYVDTKQGAKNNFESTYIEADESLPDKDGNIQEDVVRRKVNRKLFDSDREVYTRENPETGEEKYYTKWKVNRFGGKEKEISKDRYFKIKKKMKKRQDRVRGSQFVRVDASE